MTNEYSNRFNDLLRSTNREGVVQVIGCLESLGFFKAPASARHHLAVEGGLVRHSLNVYSQSEAIREAQIRLDGSLEQELPMDSVIIASLLHDVCKADIYRKVERFRKDENGKWEKYWTYDADYSDYPLGHGEKSVVRLLRMGLVMTEQEIAAIRWHMAGWELPDSMESKGNFSAACMKYPLLSVIVAADELATRITEVRDGK